MFSIQLRRGPAKDLSEAEVEIILDDAGIQALIKELQFLQTKSKDHIHFMTAAWGEGSLSEQTFGSDASLVHHLKIAKVD